MRDIRSLAFQNAPKKRRCFHCNELFTRKDRHRYMAVIRHGGLLGSVMYHVHCFEPANNGMPGVCDLRQVQFYGPRATVENEDEALSVFRESAERFGGVRVPIVRPAVH